MAKPPLAHRAPRRSVDDFDDAYEPRQPRRPPASNQAWKVVILVIALVLFLPCAGVGYLAYICFAPLTVVTAPAAFSAPAATQHHQAVTTVRQDRGTLRATAG